MKLEVCVTTIADVRNALAGGADRLELCSALATGGVTPSQGLIGQTVGIVDRSIPVNVLIRPREGDFVYSPDEVAAMASDITACARMGVSGVVIGALAPDGSLDCSNLSLLASLACDLGLTVTLSRAIDCTPDPVAAVPQAIDCGCHRILTSGGKATAIEGAEVLTRMRHAAAGRLMIMAGSGINDSNLTRLLSAADIDEVHGSFRGARAFGHDSNPLPGLDSHMRHTSAQCVAKAKQIIQTYRPTP